MKNEILSLYPKEVWEKFHKITQVPRPSNKPDEISEFVINFSNNLGLESKKDSFGNIIIKKPATKGMENKKSVVLQAHLDMVPEKNSEKTHDFEKDPIETLVEGDWVKANDTTLGADNGIGVAAALAVLESDEMEHGPIEVLFTLDEEAGLVGASKLDQGLIDSEIMINLDTEDWGEIYIGGAGGVDTIVEFKYNKEESHEDYEISSKSKRKQNTYRVSFRSSKLWPKNCRNKRWKFNECNTA